MTDDLTSTEDSGTQHPTIGATAAAATDTRGVLSRWTPRALLILGIILWLWNTNVAYQQEQLGRLDGAQYCNTAINGDNSDCLANAQNEIDIYDRAHALAWIGILLIAFSVALILIPYFKQRWRDPASGNPHTRCPWCRARIRGDALVCRHCGRDVHAGTPNRCRSCGTAVSTDAQFCTRCGSHSGVTSESPAAPTPGPSVASIRVAPRSGRPVQPRSRTPRMLTRALGAALVMLGALILASEWLGRPLRFLTEGYAGRQQIAGILLFLAWPVLCIAAGYLLLRSRYPRDAAGIGLGVAPFTVMYVEDNGLAALALLVATVVIILCLMYLSTGALPTRSGSASFRYAGLGIGLFGLLLAALGTPGYYAYQFLGWLATVAILITITITNRGVAQFGMLLGVLFTIGLWVLTIGGDAYWASVEFMIGVLIAVAAVLAYMGRPDYGDMEEAAIAPVHRPTSSAPAPIKMLDASGDPDEASLQGLGHTEPVSGVHEPRHLAMDEGSPESGSSPE